LLVLCGHCQGFYCEVHRLNLVKGAPSAEQLLAVWRVSKHPALSKSIWLTVPCFSAHLHHFITISSWFPGQNTSVTPDSFIPTPALTCAACLRSCLLICSHTMTRELSETQICFSHSYLLSVLTAH
jgi:hypothetical protein